MQATAAGTENEGYCCWYCKCRLLLLLRLQMQASAARTTNASHCSWDCKCKLLLVGFKGARSIQAGIQTRWCHTHDIGFRGLKDAGVGGVGFSSVVSES